MQPQTMMLPPSCLNVGKAQFSWYSSPGRHHTCWTPSESNKFTLWRFSTAWYGTVRYGSLLGGFPLGTLPGRLIRPQDMVPVIHVLGQVVFSKLFAGFFASQFQKRIPSGMLAMQTDLLQCVAYGLSPDKLTFHFCILKSNAGSTRAFVF